MGVAHCIGSYTSIRLIYKEAWGRPLGFLGAGRGTPLTGPFRGEEGRAERRGRLATICLNGFSNLPASLSPAESLFGNPRSHPAPRGQSETGDSHWRVLTRNVSDGGAGVGGYLQGLTSLLFQIQPTFSLAFLSHRAPESLSSGLAAVL